MKVEVRKTGKAESKKIYNIAKKLSPKWFDEVAINKTIPNDLKNHPSLIALTDGEVAGFVNYKINDKVAEINWMGVDPNHFREGVGSKLLNKLVKTLKSDEVSRIKVETLDKKEGYKPYNRTRGFYISQGFKKIEEKKEYSEAAEEELILAIFSKGI